MASVSSRKKYSQDSELKAIMTLCHDGKTSSQQAASLLISTLTADHFVTPIGEACYKRVRHLLKSRSELPDLDDLFEDPGIDADTRTSLRMHYKNGMRGLRGAEKARKLVRRLEQFRKLRALFGIGHKLEDALHQDEVDPDNIIAELATAVTNAGSTQRQMRVTSRGDGNTTLRIAKQILNGEGVHFIPTGFEPFDNINSGIPRGAFMLVETVTGGGKCITGDSLVPTSNGIMSMEELWAKRGKSIGQGFYELKTVVRNHNNKKVWTRGIYSKQARTREVLFDYNMRIRGTDEHRMWTYNPDTLEYSFKKLQDLQVGDWLPRTIEPDLYNRHPSRQGISISMNIDWTRLMRSYYTGKMDYLPTRMPTYLNKDLAGLMGYMVAEGSGTDLFSNFDAEILDDYTSRYLRLFGIKPVEKSTNNFVSGLGNCTVVSDFLHHNGLHRKTSSFKEVPLCVRSSPRHIQTEFLRCLFEGDGYINNEGKISYSTTSKILAMQVISMLDNMGIKCYLRIKHGLKTKRVDAQTCYSPIIHSHSRERFAELIGFISGYKSSRLKKYCQKVKVENTTCIPAANLATKIAQILMLYHRKDLNASDLYYVRRLTRGQDFTKRYIERLLDVLATNGLAYKLGWSISRNKLNLPRSVSKLLKDLLSQDWVQVVSNESTGLVEQVYDLFVPEGNSYQVNGLLSHNSLMISQLAENFAMFGAHVGVTPLEMNTEEMVMRDMARAANVDMTELLAPKRKMSMKARKRAYKAYAKRTFDIDKRGGSVKIIEPGGDVDIQTLLNECKAFGFDVILIDYVGLLKGAEGDRQWQELGNITRYCKIWAGLNNAVVIVAAQMTADGLLRYSRTMEEHAAYAWKWKINPLTEETGIVEVEQSKARQAKQFNFYVKMDYAHMLARAATREEIANFEDMMEELQKKTRKSNTKRKGDNGGPSDDDDYDYNEDKTYNRKNTKGKYNKERDKDHGGGKWSPNYKGGGKKDKKPIRNRFDEEF